MGYTTTFIGKLKINKPVDKTTLTKLKLYPRTKHKNRQTNSRCQWIIESDHQRIVWDQVEK